MGTTFRLSDVVGLRSALSWLTAFAVLLLAGTGCDCNGEEGPVTCDPECFPWQECVNGTCVVVEPDTPTPDATPDVVEEVVEEPVEEITPEIVEEPVEDAPADVVEEPVADLPDDTPEDIEEDLPAVILCPDHLEDNNTDPTLVHATDTFVAEGTPCDALSFGNCLIECPPGSDTCTEGELIPRDGCSCQEVIDLALCGIDDTDWVEFDVLRGDTVTVRMIPDGSFVSGDFVMMLYEEGGDFQLFDRNDNVYEVIFGAETDSVDDLSARYSVRAQPNNLEADETLAYSYLIQVGPESRGCPADLWDADWTTYDPFADGESECASADCVATLSGGGTPSYVAGNLCYWDAQDWVSYTEASGSDVTRRVQIQFNSATPVEAHVFHDTGSELVGVTSHEVCSETEGAASECDDNTGFIWEDYLFESGETYHIRVRPVSETDPGTFGVAIRPTD